MYKIISMTDKDGKEKVKQFKKCKEHHPNMEGEFLYFGVLKEAVEFNTRAHCCFKWNDDSGKMMRTSAVESISEYGKKIKIVTENSIYLFEEVGE